MTGTRRPIKVVVIEDSPTQRAVLRRSLEADGDITVVGEATTAAGAVAAVLAGEPDVVTVDLHIPGGGECAIERIMADVPTPILVLSALLEGRGTTASAMSKGAAGVLLKPRRWDEASEKALRTRVRAMRRASARPPSLRMVPAAPLPSQRGPGKPIIAIASSTGGPSALTTVLRDLRTTAAPILVVQHIGPDISANLASWLGRVTECDVAIACDGEALEPGRVLIGPGGQHLTIDGRGRVKLRRAAGELHQPSADVLFQSLAAHAGRRTIAAILTGMGNDGAAGMLALHEAGALTYAQDRATSAVFGMAKAAIDLGAVRRVLPLDAIGPTMARAARTANRSMARTS